MPWQTPSLRTVREMVRDEVTGALSGAVLIGNNVLRVMSDAMAALAHLTLRYIDWVSLQLLPDTAETEWLDRHGDIWLTNADGSVGRKSASYAEGSVTFTGEEGTVIAEGTLLVSANNIGYETTEEITIGTTATVVSVRAIDTGEAGNLDVGTFIGVNNPISGVNSSVTVVTMTGGTDEEDDDDLRLRVLERIRNPPMGGAEEDYVNWTLRVSGVTRAWAYPLEMGLGTVTIRFMMDDLRAENDGFPTPSDVTTVETYLNTVRPVAVKDYYVVAPKRQLINWILTALDPDTSAIREAIRTSIESMLYEKAKPGQTIYAAWKYDAVMSAPGVRSFSLTTSDDTMETPGHMATLGDIYYVGV